MLGRIKYYKHIHIIDSSSLPILPTNYYLYTNGSFCKNN